MLARDLIVVFFKCSALWLLFKALAFLSPLVFGLTMRFAAIDDNVASFQTFQATLCLAEAVLVGAFAFFMWRLGFSIVKDARKSSFSEPLPVTLSTSALEGIAFRILGIVFIAFGLEKIAPAIQRFAYMKDSSPSFPWSEVYGVCYSIVISLFGLFLLAKPARFVAMLRKLRSAT